MTPLQFALKLLLVIAVAEFATGAAGVAIGVAVGVDVGVGVRVGVAVGVGVGGAAVVTVTVFEVALIPAELYARTL